MLPEWLGNSPVISKSSAKNNLLSTIFWLRSFDWRKLKRFSDVFRRYRNENVDNKMVKLILYQQSLSVPPENIRRRLAGYVFSGYQKRSKAWYGLIYEKLDY